MAITIRGVATQTAWSAATASPVGNYPTGVVQGDLLLAFFTTNSAHNGAATVGIWTKIQEVDDTGADSTSSLYWTIAPASPGTSFTFTSVFDATETGMVVIVAYQANSWGAGAIHKFSGIERTVAAAGLATSTATVQTKNNCLIVQFIGCDPGTGAYTATPDTSPVGTELFDVKESTGGSLAYTYVQSYQQTTAASLALDATMATADEYQVIQVAIIGGLDPPVATASGAVLVPTVEGESLGVNATTATASGAALVPTFGTGIAPPVITAAAAVKIVTGSIAFNLGADKGTSAAAVLEHAVAEAGGGGASVSEETNATALGAVLVPTVTAGVALSPSVATAAASVKVPTAGAGTFVQAVIAAASGLAQAATLIISASVAQPAPISAAASIPSSGASFSSTVSADSPPTASASVPLHGIGAATNINAVTATAQGTVLVPSVKSGVALAPSVASAQAQVLVPSLGGATVVSAEKATAQASVLVPAFSAGQVSAVSVANASVLVPGITSTSGIAISPPVCAAGAVVLQPQYYLTAVMAEIAVANAQIPVHDARAGSSGSGKLTVINSSFGVVVTNA